MRQLRVLATVATVLSLGAPAIADPIPIDKGEEMPDRCPLAVRGVEMSVKKIPGGVQLDFKAPDSAQRDGLERLVKEVGAMIEYYSKLAALDPDTTLAHDGVAIPAVDIKVHATEHGAQATIHADERKDVGTLMTQAKSFKEFWDTNSCIQQTAQQGPPPAWTMQRAKF
jgi:HAMP domain-containing protein